MSKEKYNQLVNEGFCVFENILSDALLDQLQSVTDRLCENMTEEHKNISALKEVLSELTRTRFLRN